jgi:hypothetical protein
MVPFKGLFYWLNSAWIRVPAVFVDSSIQIYSFPQVLASGFLWNPTFRLSYIASKKKISLRRRPLDGTNFVLLLSTSLEAAVPRVFPNLMYSHPPQRHHQIIPTKGPLTTVRPTLHSCVSWSDVGERKEL